jgi:hypothetical protein
MKFGKSLKDIMYDLCVTKDVIASEGANILGVPKDVFTFWRNEFRFGRYQLLNDKAEKINKEKVEKYITQLQTTDLTRKFENMSIQSLQGFKEILERYLELQKAKRVLYDPDALGNLSYELNIGCLEQAIHYLDSYCSGNLYRDFEHEAQNVKKDLMKKDLR